MSHQPIRPVPLELWCAYPDDLLDDALAARCAAMMSAEEAARWKQFRFPANQREFLATRALVRTALSACSPRPPAAWQFQANDYGKPETVPACDLAFNLSNALGLVVCLIARTVHSEIPPGAQTKIDVGVDVEALTRGEEIVPLAPDVFSPQEQAQLSALPEPERPGRALNLWTLKESYIKARGLGLALPLAGFSFLFECASGIRLETSAAIDPDPARWRFRLLDFAGHRIALMAALTQAAAPELTVWESRLGAEPPRQLPVDHAPWFPL